MPFINQLSFYMHFACYIPSQSQIRTVAYVVKVLLSMTLNHTHHMLRKVTNHLRESHAFFIPFAFSVRVKIQREKGPKGNTQSFCESPLSKGMRYDKNTKRPSSKITKMSVLHLFRTLVAVVCRDFCLLSLYHFLLVT